MSIIKNEIPILEFDTEQNAVLNPTHENLDIKLPKKCVFAFLAGYIDEYARKNNLTQAAQFISATKYYPIYIANYKGEKVALCQAPVGAVPAACSAFRGANWGMILYTADSLADVEQYDERNFDGSAYEYALMLCLDAVVKM